MIAASSERWLKSRALVYNNINNFFAYYRYKMLKLLLLTTLLIQSILGPPVDKKETIAEPGQNETVKDIDLGLEYNKYLQEVVQILENDPEFRKKLESAKVDEIRDGTIAKAKWPSSPIHCQD